MRKLDAIFKWAGFTMLLAVLLVAPWIFAAWEMWWFWPMAVIIFAAAACFAGRMVLCHKFGRRHLRFTNITVPVAAAFLPFLVYAFLRFLQTEVHLDAERSFLLFLTAYLVAVSVGIGFSRRQLRILFWVLLVNCAAVGLYAVINHNLTGSRNVMWQHGFEQYYQAGRASGPYYCPDHFSALMEIALAVSLALVVTRGASVSLRLIGTAVGVIALVGILMAKSRGGMLTAFVILVALFAIGFYQYRPAVRWGLRFGCLAILLAAALLFAFSELPFARRFRDYPWKKIETGDRGLMIAGAIRAWRHAPVYGIGAGMHRHMWLHVAASDDGDQIAGRWPTTLNSSFHSYEVHSDWVQLLEEYGLIGLFLFLFAAGVGFGVVWRDWRQRRMASITAAVETPCREHDHPWMTLAALLIITAMAFHSLGDFSLQMPATTWIMAALLGATIGMIADDMRVSDSGGRRGR